MRVAYNKPMSGTRYRLLQALNRCGFHTGTQIGARLGLTRAAVHKHVQALVEQGLPIHRVRGRGYRLADGVTLLDAEAITRRLSAEARGQLSAIELLEEVDSTSAELARGSAAVAFHGRVCLAEKQNAGRGRRGRSWSAAPYRDVMMSIGIEYPQWPAHLPTLGLVTALSVINALEGLGARSLMVKWPNDIVHEDRKVCGVLLDVTGEAHGACRVIVGIGINVAAGGSRERNIDQPWTDLETLTGRMPDRNIIVAQLLSRLLPAYREFPAQGFAPYRQAWRRLDALRDRRVTIHGADGASFDGKAVGVDASGRLNVVGADGRVREFTQGDVSVRLP